jgi:hypothetical protein
VIPPSTFPFSSLSFCSSSDNCIRLTKLKNYHTELTSRRKILETNQPKGDYNSLSENFGCFWRFD